MLFPKGPRFDPLKGVPHSKLIYLPNADFGLVPDVPGPNTYNVDQDIESNLDAYKRGAFLEKTDRFGEEKMADGPGPNTYEAEPKPRTKPTAAKAAPKQLSSADRYTALQRKLEDLERVHADGKKEHHLELERLKAELNRSRQTVTEQADRLEKLKKTNDTLDTRLQDLKKSSATDQAEIKDLRVKLRMSEHERTQLAAKQGEVGETKKALQAAETRRKEEAREKDKKLAELEKALAGEKKKREAADAKLKEAKTKADEELKEAREAAKGLQAQIDGAQNDARAAQSSLAALGGEAAHKETTLLAHLEQCRATLSRVAEEYGRLAAGTVSAAEHSQLKHEHTGLQMRTWRLERKLANSEGQVVELASLIRQTKEKSVFLAAQLQDAQDAVTFYSRTLKEVSRDAQPAVLGDTALEGDVAALSADILAHRHRIRESGADEAVAIVDFYRLGCAQIMAFHSEADIALTEHQQFAQQQAAQLSAATAARDELASQLDAARAEHLAAQKLLANATAAVSEAQVENVATKAQIARLEGEMREATVKNTEALRVERQIAQRASSAAQVVKMSEEGLRAEVEQLTAELTEAERYQEAYHSLVEEVGQLMDRNDLAEEEAERLSQFNAEIIGHRNPSQRIMYVDRIRRELADTKQELLLLARDRDAIAAANEELEHELGMYKSVMVHGAKPRTHITRVERPAPLASQNLNVSSSTGSLGKGNGVSVGKASQASTLEPIPGDMTLDELAS
ncbi:hypothetical protein HWV62_8315 [Athelia sp. TMB]|nr:hypothetical protein HWV62_8315 [Athelia sp. TMB]